MRRAKWISGIGGGHCVVVLHWVHQGNGRRRRESGHSGQIFCSQPGLDGPPVTGTDQHSDPRKGPFPGYLAPRVQFSPSAALCAIAASRPPLPILVSGEFSASIFFGVCQNAIA
jgi:hypothetical protein